MNKNNIDHNVYINSNISLTNDLQIDTSDNIKKQKDYLINYFNTNNHGISVVFGDVQSGKTKFLISVLKGIINKKVIDNIILFSGPLNCLNTQTNERITKELKNILEINKYSLYDQIPSKIRKGKKYFIICKTRNEEIAELERLNSLFTNKILIAVDESDYSSNEDNNKDETKVFKCWQNLYDNNKKLFFLFISATPYRNCLLNEKTKSLRPNIIIPKENNNDYYGLNYFFTDDNCNNIKIEKRKETAIKNSFNYFFKHLLENKKNKKYTMLINNSVKTIDHKDEEKQIEKLIKNKKFETDVNSDERKILNNLEKNILILNSNNPKSTLSSINKSNNIIIGGNLLSRGITFKNLITEVIFNYASSSRPSTILQRARWFGYRKDNIEKINIYMNKELSILYYVIRKFNNFCINKLDKNKYIFNDDMHNKFNKYYESLCNKYGIKRNNKGAKIE